MKQWFPLLTAGPRFLWYSSQNLFPKSRRRLEKLGRRLQVSLVGLMYGKQIEFAKQAQGHHARHAPAAAPSGKG